MFRCLPLSGPPDHGPVIPSLQIAMPLALLIDDEPGIRFALRRWFERQGYTVVEAATGPEALEQVAAITDDDEVAVILCDLHLPGMNGDAILAHLLATRPALAARTILTTGDSISDAAAASVLHTHPYVLPKPFELAGLRAIVERVRQAR